MSTPAHFSQLGLAKLAFVSPQLQLERSHDPAFLIWQVHGGEESACRGPQHLNLKQHRQARLLAGLVGEEVPAELDQMDFDEADRWIGRRFAKWMGKEKDEV